MCIAKLKEALYDCLITFDRRVLLTNLVNEYQLPIEDISETLIEHLAKQENEGVKYLKRFVVHGVEIDNNNREIFSIVEGETKLKEWLQKLQNAESALYSVEVVGGARAPAEDLKPVAWCAIKLQKLEERVDGTKQICDSVPKQTTSTTIIKKETDIDTKAAKNIAAKTLSNNSKSGTSSKEKTNDFATNTAASNVVAANSKKVSPQEKKNTSDATGGKKASQEKKTAVPNGQKGIGNFFATVGKEPNDGADKVAGGATRPKTPKKINNFFKKRADTPPSSKESPKQSEKAANISVQLFTEGEETENVPAEVVESSSSDEEEELNAMRRKVADVDAIEATTATSSRKRLRIEDSDDDDNTEEKAEQPQQKQGKLNESATVVADSPPKSETYLDEDGFVITVKSKKKCVKPAADALVQETPSRPDPKANKSAALLAAKTKQGNIMNFFKKK